MILQATVKDGIPLELLLYIAILVGKVGYMFFIILAKKPTNIVTLLKTAAEEERLEKLFESTVDWTSPGL